MTDDRSRSLDNGMSNVFPSFRRCCTTPISDLFRLQFTGSLDWLTQLQESELPTQVKEIIERVVCESRLMRFEKSAVTRELVAHFQDGVQSGQSFEKLIQDFGDPAITAQLIRRSKLRNRPMLVKLLRGLGIGVGMLIVAYLLVTVYFYMGKPTPSVDFVAEMNRPLAEIDERDMAWPIYRPLWTKYGFSEGGGMDLEAIFYRNPDDEESGRVMRPTDPGWSATVETLAKYEDLLKGFRRGAKLPHLGIELQSDPRNYSDEDFAAIMPNRDKATYKPYSSGLSGEPTSPEVAALMEGSPILVLLPHVQVLRTAARMFVADTRLAVEQGDTQRAAENIKTFFGLARQAAEGELLVCSLVGFAVAGIGFDQLEEVVVSNPNFFSAAQLAEIQKSVEGASPRDWMNVEGERAMLHDMIQRVYTDDGRGDGRMTPAGVKILTDVSRWWRIYPDEEEFGFEEVLGATRNVVAPASLFVCASRKEMTEKGDEMLNEFIADLDNPFWQDGRRDHDQFLKENELKYNLLAILFPATQQVRNAMHRTIGRRDGVIAALACHRYFLEYGEWPQDYADVSPEFVTEFPIDQVNGALLNFKYEDDQLLIYSVGNDRDDDGGKDRVFHGQVQPRQHFIFGAQRDELDGDWIVWPSRHDVY